ncbi:MAG: hypothetical protein IJH67_06765 [Thermoguttaceae bacterium]|nr:hypothetical protein [Thermoguttaceae bacterium]
MKTLRLIYPGVIRLLMPAALFVFMASAWADVAVISNRMEKGVAFVVAQKGKPQQTVRLASGDAYSFFFDGQSALAFNDGQRNQQVPLEPQSVYFFGTSPEGNMFFQKLPITGNPVGAFRMDENAAPTFSSSVTYSPLGMKIIEVPVKIYVDDNEYSKQSVWEPRLRKRIDKVNEVYERLCHLRFKVVGVGQWKSDDNIHDFITSMKEFEAMAPAYPAALAIGFTSQYGVKPGVDHIGMTRQPFHTHILIREFAPQFSENERVEALIHELGHWLGAVHNPDPHCYMNPTLAERESRRAAYVKTFNPINALLINLWADVWSNRKNGLMNMSDKRIEEFIEIYSFMSKIPHTDANAASIEKLLMIVAQQEKIRREQIRRAMGVVKPVLTMPDDLDAYASTIPEMNEKPKEEVAENATPPQTTASESQLAKPEQNDEVEVAQTPPSRNDNNENKIETPEPRTETPEDNSANVAVNNAPSKGEDEDAPPAQPEASADSVIVPSDTMSVNKAVRYVSQEILNSMEGQNLDPNKNEYVNHIVRSGAAAAAKLPEKHRVRAFLVAIGMAMDLSNSMKVLPIVGDRVKKMDSYDLQVRRDELIKQSSINNRSDWSQHFGVSAALSALMSPDAARQAGLIKELKDDSTPGNAFDVGDLAADMAGCTFAQRLLDGKLTLNSVAQSFDVGKWIPDVKGYRPNLKKPDKIMKDIQKKVDEKIRQ